MGPLTLAVSWILFIASFIGKSDSSWPLTNGRIQTCESFIQSRFRCFKLVWCFNCSPNTYWDYWGLIKTHWIWYTSLIIFITLLHYITFILLLPKNSEGGFDPWSYVFYPSSLSGLHWPGHLPEYHEGCLAEFFLPLKWLQWGQAGSRCLLDFWTWNWCGNDVELIWKTCATWKTTLRSPDQRGSAQRSGRFEVSFWAQLQTLQTQLKVHSTHHVKP